MFLLHQGPKEPVTYNGGSLELRDDCPDFYLRGKQMVDVALSHGIQPFDLKWVMGLEFKIYWLSRAKSGIPMSDGYDKYKVACKRPDYFEFLGIEASVCPKLDIVMLATKSMEYVFGYATLEEMGIDLL